MDTKLCPVCGGVKRGTEFHRSSASTDGLQYACKDCANARRRRAYRENIDYERARHLRRCPACRGSMYSGSRLCETCFEREQIADLDLASLASSAEDVAWLAGILEGEAYFKPKPRSRIQLRMTDRDVMERAAQLMGHTERLSTRVEVRGQKTLHTVVVAHQDVMDRITERIGPWMGDRRRAEISAAAPDAPLGNRVRMESDADPAALLGPQLHWVAGLLEGEGSFLRPAPSAPNRPVLVVEMTDRDVVERCAALWGVTTHRNKPRNVRCKPSFVARLRGRRAVEWMHALRPLMGARRQRQIAIAVDAWSPKPNGRQKLSDDQVAELVGRKQAGECARSLADEFGRSRSYVYALASGGGRA